jgi:hypothetical protein
MCETAQEMEREKDGTTQAYIDLLEILQGEFRRQAPWDLVRPS